MVFFKILFFNFSENDIFDEESNYGQFYTAFSALAADTVSQCKLGKCTIDFFALIKKVG